MYRGKKGSANEYTHIYKYVYVKKVLNFIKSDGFRSQRLELLFC